jgi:peptidoglycan/xylan/chitin deacetylase (PgdA/CDA1 family)
MTESDPSHPWWLDFHGQMALIEDLGYRVVPLEEVVAAVRREEAPQEPLLAVTFDDGWASNLDGAFPELARRGWPATVFVATSYLDRPPYVASGQIPRILELGISLGNHTHGHRDVTGLSDEKIHAEIAECSRRIVNLAGTAPSHFCYPNGRYSPRARAAVAKAGLSGACSGRVGPNPPGTDPLLLRRLTVEAGDGPRELRWRLSGGYDFLDRRQRHMDRDPS